MTEKAPLPEQVAESFQQLKAVATELNAASDELGKPIAALDEALRRLNLGVSAWVTVKGDTYQDNSYWYVDLGYAKVNSTWGIAIRERSGYADDEGGKDETWLFGSAPRTHRVDVIDKLPELLAKLTAAASKTTEKLREKLGKAEQVAAAVGGRRSTLAGQIRALADNKETE